MRFNLRYIFLQLYGLYIFRRRVGVLGFFSVGDRKKIRIGAGCGINHGVFLLGHNDITIGNNVVLSQGVILLDSGLDVDRYLEFAKPPHIASFVHVEDDAWIGARAIILPGVTVGKSSIVGAGSVVTKNVPPFTVVAGNPARVVRRLKD